MGIFFKFFVLCTATKVLNCAIVFLFVHTFFVCLVFVQQRFENGSSRCIFASEPTFLHIHFPRWWNWAQRYVIGKLRSIREKQVVGTIFLLLLLCSMRLGSLLMHSLLVFFLTKRLFLQFGVFYSFFEEETFHSMEL